MTYHPFDQTEKLGPPPWDPLAEEVADWEREHGHDVRLKCSPEFGCRVMPTSVDVGLHVGQPVSKKAGYEFDSHVVAVFHKLDGQVRIVCEDDRGLLHIFNPTQMEPR